MAIDFRYSLIEDLRILYRIYRKPVDYRSLRSVFWNPFVMVSFALNSKKNLEFIRRKWEKIKIPNEILRETLTCYITSVGPEGMFDVKRNVIHSRYSKLDKFGGWDGFVETVFHEAIHIEIYDDKTYSYEAEEKKVEEFLKDIYK